MLPPNQVFPERETSWGTQIQAIQLSPVHTEWLSQWCFHSLKQNVQNLGPYAGAVSNGTSWKLYDTLRNVWKPSCRPSQRKPCLDFNGLWLVLCLLSLGPGCCDIVCRLHCRGICFSMSVSLGRKVKVKTGETNHFDHILKLKLTSTLSPLILNSTLSQLSSRKLIIHNQTRKIFQERTVPISLSDSSTSRLKTLYCLILWLFLFCYWMKE